MLLYLKPLFIITFLLRKRQLFVCRGGVGLLPHSRYAAAATLGSRPAFLSEAWTKTTHRVDPLPPTGQPFAFLTTPARYAVGIPIDSSAGRLLWKREADVRYRFALS